MRVLIAVALLLAAMAPTAVADGGWSVVPSGGGRPSFYAEGAPGAVLQDTVSVRNPSAEPLRVRLGGGSWVVFAHDKAAARTVTVDVPARTRAEVPFTVNVPAGAAPGDHADTLTARSSDGRSKTVRLRLRVGGPTLPALTVEHVTVRGERISYELVNRGTTTLTPSLAVRAEGLFGRRLLDRAPRTLPVELPPGRRVRLSEPWPDRPVLDAVDVRLTVTADGGTARDAGSTAVRFVPWGAVAGIAGGAMAAGAFL
ncbi:COG1361 family protein, partial [Streptomyces spongiae]